MDLAHSSSDVQGAHCRLPRPVHPRRRHPGYLRFGSWGVPVGAAASSPRTRSNSRSGRRWTRGCASPPTARPYDGPGAWHLRDGADGAVQGQPRRRPGVEAHPRAIRRRVPARTGRRRGVDDRRPPGSGNHRRRGDRQAGHRQPPGTRPRRARVGGPGTRGAVFAGGSWTRWGAAPSSTWARGAKGSCPTRTAQSGSTTATACASR